MRKAPTAGSVDAVGGGYEDARQERGLCGTKAQTPESAMAVGGLGATCGALVRVSANALALTGKGSLTITYFHTGIRTIIGVESFHGPVRDGKGWYRLAMVIRHDWLLPRRGTRQPIWEEVEVFG